ASGAAVADGAGHGGIWKTREAVESLASEFASSEGPSKDQDQQVDASRPADSGLLGIQRTIGNRAFVHMLESKGLLSRAGDEFERYADDAAKAGGLPTGADRVPRTPAVDPDDREAVDSELAGAWVLAARCPTTSGPAWNPASTPGSPTSGCIPEARPVG